MSDVENEVPVTLGGISYWQLWLFDTALVVAGVVFFLACQYGTYEFFGVACLRALLPSIPILVLVGGAGSSIFILTKVKMEQRGVKAPMGVALLVGPGLAVALLLVGLGMTKSPGHRLGYICLGNAPSTASGVKVAGYSGPLREEWLAVFNVGPKDFQTMVSGANMIPADEFELKTWLEQSALKKSKLVKQVPTLTNLICYKRVFKEQEEHQRGSVYAVYDSGSSTAVVFRGYRD